MEKILKIFRSTNYPKGLPTSYGKLLCGGTTWLGTLSANSLSERVTASEPILLKAVGEVLILSSADF